MAIKPCIEVSEFEFILLLELGHLAITLSPLFVSNSLDLAWLLLLSFLHQIFHVNADDSHHGLLLILLLKSLCFYRIYH